jgi:uncharacterized protein YebE (UPF0316 family)
MATMRVFMIMRGRKIFVWFLGFAQALVFVTAVRQVITDLDNWLYLVGYAAGFASGNVLGIWFEERLALGYVHLRIISSTYGVAIVDRLRSDGYAVTEVSGRGRDGTVSVLECTVRRAKKARVEQIVKSIDFEAFMTSENIRLARRGFWGKRQ